MADDAGAVEGVIEPEIRRKRMMRGRGDDAILEIVARSEAQDSHGFNAHVLISGSVQDRGIRLISNGAGQDVRRAAARMRDTHNRDFDLLECTIVIEVQPRKLRHAQLVVDAH